jgi:hypothetical protein
MADKQYSDAKQALDLIEREAFRETPSECSSANPTDSG